VQLLDDVMLYKLCWPLLACCGGFESGTLLNMCTGYCLERIGKKDFTKELQFTMFYGVGSISNSHLITYVILRRFTLVLHGCIQYFAFLVL